MDHYDDKFKWYKKYNETLKLDNVEDKGLNEDNAQKEAVVLERRPEAAEKAPEGSQPAVMGMPDPGTAGGGLGFDAADKAGMRPAVGDGGDFGVYGGKVVAASSVFEGDQVAPGQEAGGPEAPAALQGSGSGAVNETTSGPLAAATGGASGGEGWGGFDRQGGSGLFL